MFENLEFSTRSKAYKELGISYLGSVNCSSKLSHGMRVNVATYGLYLSPANSASPESSPNLYNVCPNSKFCKKLCLNGSGHARLEAGAGKHRIKDARILKTRLFFENHRIFMQLLIAEIAAAKALWESKGYFFAVRLNCCSDISYTQFQLDGVNICDIFKGTNFYEYTKVFSYLNDMKKFANLDYTYSYNGHNSLTCKKALDRGVRIAICFQDKLPNYFDGVPVIDGDFSDYRPANPAYCVVGLKLKKTITMFKNHKFVMPETKFIVKPTDIRCS